MAARLKKGTAQSFRLAHLARIFINLSSYDIITKLPSDCNAAFISIILHLFCTLYFVHCTLHNVHFNNNNVTAQVGGGAAKEEYRAVI